MGPFTLSVHAQHSLSLHETRKRKRGDERSNAPEIFLEEEELSSSQLPQESINPLNHSPDTLVQLSLAGLSPDEELPSTIYSSFPHKALPPRYHEALDKSDRLGKKRYGESSSTAVVENDIGYNEDPTSTHSKSRLDHSRDALALERHSARLKHLDMMTTIMHRCLNEGDIPRAKRAFGLLLQTDEIDIRSKKLWAIGSEILMRDGETGNGSHTGPQRAPDPEKQLADEEEDVAPPVPPEPRDFASNVQKVKEYFDALILHHPYSLHSPHYTSAIHFWPALFEVEIYRINTVYQKGLKALEAESAREEDEDSGLNNYGDPSDVEVTHSEEDAPGDLRYERREAERSERRWAQRDELREQTLTITGQLIVRIDQVMSGAPFNADLTFLRKFDLSASSHVEIDRSQKFLAICRLLRIWANLSMFMGDLRLSARLVEESGISHCIEDLASQHERLLGHVDGAEERVAVRQRSEAFETARELFQGLLNTGGGVDRQLRKFLNL